MVSNHTRTERFRSAAPYYRESKLCFGALNADSVRGQEEQASHGNFEFLSTETRYPFGKDKDRNAVRVLGL